MLNGVIIIYEYENKIHHGRAYLQSSQRLYTNSKNKCVDINLYEYYKPKNEVCKDEDYHAWKKVHFIMTSLTWTSTYLISNSTLSVWCNQRKEQTCNPPAGRSEIHH